LFAPLNQLFHCTTIEVNTEEFDKIKPIGEIKFYLKLGQSKEGSIFTLGRIIFLNLFCNLFITKMVDDGYEERGQWEEKMGDDRLLSESTVGKT
jgi:hypothetical protein